MTLGETVWEKPPYKIIYCGPSRYQLWKQIEIDKQVWYETLRTLPTAELCVTVVERREAR